MFASWQSFYQLTGGAAATLIGLMFIVATLTTTRSASSLNQGARLFITPTVFHLTSVLAISALSLAPEAEGRWAQLIMAAWAIGGLLYTLLVALGLRRTQLAPHWSDFWWYGAANATAYAALAVAEILVCALAPHAAFLLALSLLALLVVTIRNAWDLVTWLAPRRDEPLAQDG
jgi:hypothetical protein